MRRWLIRLLTIVTGIAVCGVLAVSLLLLTMWWEHRSAIALPTPTGPFAVGRMQLAWTNPASHEELAVWIWYPAARTNESAGPYLPAAWRSALQDRQGTFMRSFFKRDPSVVVTHSQSDAPLASRRRTYPLVLLRPGGSALTTDFTALAEDLASHGFVVAGFDAPRRSFVFVESNGQVIGRAAENNVENANGNLADPNVRRLLTLWTADTAFLVDQLERLNDGPSGAFAGRLDVGRLGIVGHSFGGATALQFCHVDSRCRAAIDLDGIPFGTVVTDGLAKPAMFLLSDHSREMSDPESHTVLSMIDSIYKRLPKPRVSATIHTANHFSFSDQILLNSHAAIALLRLTGVGALDGHRGLAISAASVRTFFDVTLNGASVATLNRLFKQYPEIVGDYAGP